MKKLLLPVIFVLFSSTSWAVQDDNIRISLEEPSSTSVSSGVSNLRGWAVAPNGISHIELYVNGTYVDTVPYGGLRADVGGAFPSYPDADNSGFSMAFGYSNLQLGKNHAAVIAYDDMGNHNISEATFQVEKFNSHWIGDPNQVDLRTVDNIRVLDNNRLIVEGVAVDGQNWDVELKWQTATQGFDIARIDPAVGASGPLAGTWRGESTVSANGESCLWNIVAKTTESSSTTGIFSVTSTLVNDSSPNVDCITSTSSFNYVINGSKVTTSLISSSAPLILFIPEGFLFSADTYVARGGAWSNGVWITGTTVLVKQ